MRRMIKCHGGWPRKRPVLVEDRADDKGRGEFSALLPPCRGVTGALRHLPGPNSCKLVRSTSYPDCGKCHESSWAASRSSAECGSSDGRPVTADPRSMPCLFEADSSHHRCLEMKGASLREFCEQISWQTSRPTSYQNS